MHHKPELGQVFVNCLPLSYGQQIFYFLHFNNHENLALVPKNFWNHIEMWRARKGDQNYQSVFGLSSKNLVVVCPNSFVQHDLVKCNLTKLTTTSLAVKRFTSVAVKQFTSIVVKRFTSLAVERPTSLAVHKLSGLAVHKLRGQAVYKLSGQVAHERSGHPAVNPISAGSHGLW